MLENEMNSRHIQRFRLVKAKTDELLISSNKETLCIAIDGKCASGKTTLAYYLESIYDCNVFHMDDFFLQDSQRTPHRLAEIGGNVDYERFQLEVLNAIEEKKNIIYRPFSCMEKRIIENKEMLPKRLNIIEGAYSMHPYFKKTYDLSIFMEIDEEEQLHNIRKRNGEERLRRFKEEWIPKENAYFDKFNIRDNCMIVNW